MSFLTEPLNYDVMGGKYLFTVNPAFDIVLDIQRLYREKDLDSLDKLDQALEMLVVKNAGKLKYLTISEKSKLLSDIYKQCINIRKHPPVREKMPSIDFEYDGEYIYASFMLDYGIDLVDMQDRLPWKKFIALFQGLSEHSKIREIIRIRNMDVPKYNGKNTKEIEQVRELKSFYALPVRGGGGQEGLDLLFSTLEGMAVKCEGYK